MAKPTMITFNKIINWENSKTYVFRTTTGVLLRISNLEDDIATIECTVGTSIESFAEIIAGCFHQKSNFKAELLAAFGLETSAEFITINFELAGVKVTVNRASATPEKICEKWYNRYPMYH